MGPPRTDVALLRKTAANHPEAAAFVSATASRLSYGEWDRAANGVAAGMSEHGVTAGDVVCLLLPSSLEYMVCYQAAMRLGAITSGINPRLGHEEVEHILHLARPRVTVVADDGERALPPSAGRALQWSRLAPY